MTSLVNRRTQFFLKILMLAVQVCVVNTVKLQIRLADIIILYQFLQAKMGSFLDFYVKKQFKMRVLLEIRVLLEGEPY